MGTIIDVVLIAVVVFFIIVGFKRGVVRSLVEFIGSLFALVVSAMFSGWIADSICNILEKNRDFSMWEYAGIRILAVILLFAVLHIVVQLAAKALDTVFHLPVLSQVNAVLGAVCGLLQGLVLAFVLCAVLQLAGPYIEINGHALSDETLAQSYLYGTVYSNSPAAGWFEQAENWL